MPGANAPSVAEGTVLLMLAALRRLPALDRATRAGPRLAVGPELGETVRDIGGCTVGLVGYGNIAKRVRRDRRRDGRHRRCTPAPATTGGPAGGGCPNCWPTATSSRCTCR